MDKLPLYWFVENDQEVTKYFRSKYDLPNDVDWGRFKYIGYVGEEYGLPSDHNGCYASQNSSGFTRKNVHCEFLKRDKFWELTQDKKMDVWNVCFNGSTVAADWQEFVMQDKCNARLLDNERYYSLRKPCDGSLLFF